MTRHSFDGIIKRKKRGEPPEKPKSTARKAVSFKSRKISREKFLLEKREAQKRIKRNEPNKHRSILRSKIADKRKTRKIRGKFFTAKRAVALVAIIVIAIIGSLFYRVLHTGANIFENGDSPIRKLTNLITKQETPVAGEDKDRIDIILLGIGGTGNPGPDLTDTIQVLSIKPSTEQMAMLSIPRDLYVQIPETGEYSRVNKLNYFGGLDDKNDEQAGPMFTKKAVEEITGEDIEYLVKIDFEGFNNVINALDGVEIDVPNSFIDHEYPLGLGYQTVKFERGLQLMDGETALKFARSRKGYATDDSGEVEGTDFARSKRQQLVIDATKNKVFSLEILTNPTKLNSILEALDEHLVTNLELWEAIRIFTLVKNISPDTITTEVLSSENYLKPYSTPDGAALLIPQEGASKYEEIQNYFKNVFSMQQIAESEDKNTEKNSGSNEEQSQIPSEPEQAAIEIRNGTSTTGLAQRTSVNLRNQDLDVVKFGNADTFEYSSTLIYDFSEGSNPETLSTLESFFNVRVQENIPSNLLSENDFVIILGTDLAIKEQQ